MLEYWQNFQQIYCTSGPDTGLPVKAVSTPGEILRRPDARRPWDARKHVQIPLPYQQQ